MQKKEVKRFYVFDSLVPFDEDETHEFKGHRCFFPEELPAWNLINESEKVSRTRKHISRDINGFLNTGKGGTIYLGILDNGTVKGISLTQFQKDHISATMFELMNCYAPPVPRHRYKIKFIPVLEKDHSNPEDICNYNSSLNADPGLRGRSHELRTKRYCWCDKEATAQYNMGVIAPFYVVEIIIKQWDKCDPRNKCKPNGIQLHPIYQDESGNCYMRLLSSVTNLTYQDVKNLTISSVNNYYQETIERLQKELKDL